MCDKNKMWRSESLLVRYRSAVSGSSSKDVDITCTRIAWDKGTAAFGAFLNSLAQRDIRFGTMIAGNSGRIAGACGNTLKMEFQNIHPGHTTQEENMVSNWVTTMTMYRYKRKELFQQLLDENNLPRWGLKKPLDARDTSTFQGKDYTVAAPSDYYDAWAVQDALLSADSLGSGGLYTTSLVFVAGPNVGARGQPNGSMARTFNSTLASSYVAFREGVKQAVSAGLAKMDNLQCQVALVAGVSTGIYAKPFQLQINVDFINIVNEILREKRPEHIQLVYFIVFPSEAHADRSRDPATRKKLQDDVDLIDRGQKPSD